MKVAINGFGRIGRSVFRILQERPDVEVVAVNDITDPAALAYLLRHDTVMGGFAGSVVLDGDKFVTDRGSTRITAIRNPAELPWAELGVDIAIESTGIFRKRAEVAQHLEAGAGKVILTVPAKDEIDATIVLGVNNEDLKSEHKVVSNASCTTNCLAPLAYVLDKEFGIERGLMTTTHAYTNDQKILDLPHSDLRRARAAGVSMIPTTTGAAKALALVVPETKGKLDGMAIRVPTPNVSIVDLVALLSKDVTEADLANAFKTYADGKMKGILGYSDEPLVSIDYNGNPNSSTIDMLSLKVIGGRMVKVLSWYDNESGFSNRMSELFGFVAQK